MPPTARGRAPFAHEMRAGDSYLPFAFTIGADLNEQFLFAIRDYDPAYVSGSVDGQPLVHPVLLLHMSARTRSPSFVLAPNMGSVFAKDKAVFCTPAYVGDNLLVEWTIHDVYEKRSMIYQELHTKVTRVDGDLVLRREAHSVFFVALSSKETPR